MTNESKGGFVLIDIAYAMGQGGAPGAAGQGAGGFSSLFPIILVFVIFYFLLIRPQQKQRKQHQEMIARLKKGDRIITSGGIHGRVTSVGDTTLTVEISEKVRVKLVKGNVAGLVGAQSQTPTAKNGKPDSKKEK